MPVQNAKTTRGSNANVKFMISTSGSFDSAQYLAFAKRDAAPAQVVGNMVKLSQKWFTHSLQTGSNAPHYHNDLLEIPAHKTRERRADAACQRINQSRCRTCKPSTARNHHVPWRRFACKTVLQTTNGGMLRGFPTIKAQPVGPDCADVAKAFILHELTLHTRLFALCSRLS
jgi:hypothetical protein